MQSQQQAAKNQEIVSFERRIKELEGQKISEIADLKRLLN
jgi:hypothetical protein